MKITNHIPNTITLCNLLSGSLAIYAAFHGGNELWGLLGYQWTWIFIGMAAVFDFCDGMAARLLHAYSSLGKELDSLSDLVSFGVAPAMLMLNALACQPQTWAFTPFVALFIPLMGALRLAKFNIDDSQSTSFKGLPIPANAIVWIGISALIWQHTLGIVGQIWLIIGMVAVSLLMVSRIDMFSLKMKSLSPQGNMRRYLLVAVCAALVIWFGIPGLAYTIGFYVLLSLATGR